MTSESVRISVVSAGLSDPSSSRMLADRLLISATHQLGERGIEAAASVHELRDVAHDITNSMLTGFAPTALAEMNADVSAADALIVVTPIFQAGYSGLFKSWLDVLDRDALDGTPVLIGATAGTPRHSLALDYAIRPVLTYLHAEPVSTAVFAASADWGESADQVAPLQKRVDRGARELAERIVGGAQERRADPYSPEAYLGEGGSFADLLTNLPRG
ncbi:CE1759 family FMN reductase [Microbacterium sp. G2-8]|uniref:CE1759 family FMN reductase n=1 Tax=Microbacterium sp. G2-8 TaxID=2842454 RepID=UPI001C8B095F|nr:CE1759 family FMN reductase [Microbacterium sp. G2-8]